MTRLAPPTDLVVLIGHGTRSELGQREFRALAARAREHFGVPVVPGFIEFASPTMFEAADEAARLGAHRITVAPAVLVGAGHLKDDAAAVAARLRAAAPAASVRLASALGAQHELLELACTRVLAAAGGSIDGLLVVARGSTDPAANAEVAKISRLLAERVGVDLVMEAFVSLARPSVVEGLRRLVRLGARRVVVAPWWLFAGVLLDRAAHPVREAGRVLGVEVRVAERFGPDPAVLDALWYGILDAWRGVRRTCDDCLWRPPFSTRPPRDVAPTSVRLEIGIGAREPHRLARFWSDLLGYRVGDLDAAGAYLDLVPPSSELPIVFLQRLDDVSRATNRVHLDLYSDDREAMRERALALGATQRSTLRSGAEGGAWYVLADPEGNEFCVMQADEPDADRGRPSPGANTHVATPPTGPWHD